MRDASTGQLLSGGQFDLSTFSSYINNFINFDPNVRNHVVMVTASAGNPADIIAGNVVLSY